MKRYFFLSKEHTRGKRVLSGVKYVIFQLVKLSQRGERTKITLVKLMISI